MSVCSSLNSRSVGSSPGEDKFFKIYFLVLEFFILDYFVTKELNAGEKIGFMVNLTWMPGPPVYGPVRSSNFFDTVHMRTSPNFSTIRI